MTAWTRKSMYHLVGPDGWSICRVHIGKEAFYELWQVGKERFDMKCHHRATTADACKQRYEEITNGND